MYLNPDNLQLVVHINDDPRYACQTKQRKMNPNLTTHQLGHLRLATSEQLPEGVVSTHKLGRGRASNRLRRTRLPLLSHSLESYLTAIRIVQKILELRQIIIDIHW